MMVMVNYELVVDAEKRIAKLEAQLAEAEQRLVELQARLAEALEINSRAQEIIVELEGIKAKDRAKLAEAEKTIHNAGVSLMTFGKTLVNRAAPHRGDPPLVI
jgi:uncharacterized coiled-coil protein SlyX